MFGRNRPRLTFEIEPSKPYFISQSRFYKIRLALHFKPPGKYLWKELFKSHSGTHFFSDPPFSKFGTERCPPTTRKCVCESFGLMQVSSTRTSETLACRVTYTFQTKQDLKYKGTLGVCWSYGLHYTPSEWSARGHYKW